MEEAKANLLDALKLVLEYQRELAEKDLSPKAVRETIEKAFQRCSGSADAELPDLRLSWRHDFPSSTGIRRFEQLRVVQTNSVHEPHRQCAVVMLE